MREIENRNSGEMEFRDEEEGERSEITKKTE